MRDTSPVKPVFFRIPEDIKRRFYAACRKRRMPMSTVVFHMIEEYLKEHEEQPAMDETATRSNIPSLRGVTIRNSKSTAA